MNISSYTIFMIGFSDNSVEMMKTFFISLGHKSIGSVNNVNDAISSIKQKHPNIVVIHSKEEERDILTLRKEYFCSVILIGNLSSPRNITKLLSISCADYIPKPCTQELFSISLSRLALLCPKMSEIHFKHGCKFQIQNAQLTCKGIRIPLSPQEQQLITLMATHKGGFLSYEKIEHTLWPEDAPKSDSSRKNLFQSIERKIKAKEKKTSFWSIKYGKGVTIL